MASANCVRHQPRWTTLNPLRRSCSRPGVSVLRSTRGHHGLARSAFVHNSAFVGAALARLSRSCDRMDFDHHSLTCISRRTYRSLILGLD
jgi:hypothetical protein